MAGSNRAVLRLFLAYYSPLRWPGLVSVRFTGKVLGLRRKSGKF